jgi:hypothetical protein
VEAVFQTIGCLADLGIDGWIGSDFGRILSKPSIEETHYKIRGLHKFLSDEQPSSADRITTSKGKNNFERLTGAMRELRDPQISSQKRRQLRADLSLAMRRYVHPNARVAKSARDSLKLNIDKLATRQRRGEISGTERKELEELTKDQAQNQSVQRALEYLRKEFKGLDKEQKIFTTGERFRRDILNAWGAVARFSVRHRILVVSSVTLALVLGTIGSFIAQRKRDHH